MVRFSLAKVDKFDYFVRSCLSIPYDYRLLFRGDQLLLTVVSFYS